MIDGLSSSSASSKPGIAFSSGINDASTFVR
jgi:hypothetical protein